MEINILRKNIPKDCVKVEFTPTSVSVTIKMPDDEEAYSFQTALYGEVSRVMGALMNPVDAGSSLAIDKANVGLCRSTLVPAATVF